MLLCEKNKQAIDKTFVIYLERISCSQERTAFFFVRGEQTLNFKSMRSDVIRVMLTHYS